jgi:hypothetical protein
MWKEQPRLTYSDILMVKLTICPTNVQCVHQMMGIIAKVNIECLSIAVLLIIVYFKCNHTQIP